MGPSIDAARKVYKHAHIFYKFSLFGRERNAQYQGYLALLLMCRFSHCAQELFLKVCVEGY